ncbi:MAG: hypothetical protein U5L95_02550 [Candidatus Saccharibacteria bacterium]|nr:hypothetical protein [Candidatus Saccharibacteria bacterium]
MKASMVVMSHLSDAQEIISHTNGDEATKRINFAKFIILRTGGDLTQEIDPDALWEEFTNR